MTYADYTRNTGEPLKRISHARRYQQIIERIAAPLESDIVLDYGCGDGHLFSCFIDQKFDRISLVGYDPNPLLLAEAADEVRNGSTLTTDIETLKRQMPFGFSLIYCTEVCEHLTSKAMMELFENIKALAKPAARIVFGVPIETGPSGFLKNLYRVAKGMRNPANLHNAALSLFAIPIDRPVTDVEWHGDHTGFDHVKFRKSLRINGFEIERTSHLPLMFTRSALNNEIYFTCYVP